MPDLGSSTFSQTDANNNTGTAPSWSGSAAPSTLDDAGRALQGAITREWNWRNYTLTAAGTADAKTLTFSVAPAAYYNGQRFAFIANTVNTGSATLNVNSLGAKTIKKLDSTGAAANLAAGDMVAGMFVELAYNTSGDCFYWVNRSVGGPISTYSFTMATDRLLGRESASTGVIEEISLGSGLGLSSTTLALTGPAFIARRTTNQSISSNTPTKVQLSTEDYDTNTNFDNATNYRFTPTVAGFYQFNGEVYIEATDMTFPAANIYKNGASVTGTYLGTTSATFGSLNLTAAGLVYMNGSTDYVELYAKATAAGTINVQGRFSGCFMRGT